MNEIRAVSARDVCVSINGKKLLQAESVQLKQTVGIHSIRSCFCSDDKAHIKYRPQYKLNLTGLTFLRPFENCNYSDLDDFSVTVEIDGVLYHLLHCMWDDYQFTVHQQAMKEHISIIALRMEKEIKSDEGT